MRRCVFLLLCLAVCGVVRADSEAERFAEAQRRLEAKQKAARDALQAKDQAAAQSALDRAEAARTAAEQQVVALKKQVADLQQQINELKDRLASAEEETRVVRQQTVKASQAASPQTKPADQKVNNIPTPREAAVARGELIVGMTERELYEVVAATNKRLGTTIDFECSKTTESMDRSGKRRVEKVFTTNDWVAVTVDGVVVKVTHY